MVSWHRSPGPRERGGATCVRRTALRLLDTPPDGAFDRIAAIAARLFGVPIATVLRANGDVEALGTPGRLLGVVPDVDVTDASVELRRGDTLVLVTDGVYDSGYPDRLGREGFEQILGRCVGLSAAQIVERVHSAVARGQRDDIAILAIAPRPETA